MGRGGPPPKAPLSPPVGTVGSNRRAEPTSRAPPLALALRVSRTRAMQGGRRAPPHQGKSGTVPTAEMTARQVRSIGDGPLRHYTGAGRSWGFSPRPGLQAHQVQGREPVTMTADRTHQGPSRTHPKNGTKPKLERKQRERRGELERGNAGKTRSGLRVVCSQLAT